MKKFELQADITFYAEDIDDACLRLSKHFLDLQINGESDLIELGQIELSPTKEGGEE